MVTLSPQLLARVRQIRTQVLTDVQEGFSPTTFVAWRKNRPATGAETWDNGGASEGWVQGVSGKGIIRRGQDMPVIGEGLISQQTRYDFRTATSYGLTVSHFLVIDGTRLFKIEGAPVEDVEDPIMTVTLVEVTDITLPVPEEPEPAP